MPDPSSEWTTQEVLDRLRSRTAKGAPAKLHVFLRGSIPPDRTEEVARRIADAATAETGTAPAKVASVRKSARSFSVAADLPTLEVIARQDEVSTILPAEIEDAYPKPVRRGERLA